MGNNKSKRKLKEDKHTLKIKENDHNKKEIKEFPKLLCLEHCNTNIVKGYEKHVIDTLKAFSNKDRFKSKNSHHLEKSDKIRTFFDISKRFANGKVWTLDLKARNDKYRLFYCIDYSQVHKVLALCSDKSHL